MTLTNSLNTRKAQLILSGLGQHFVSPRKTRDKRKTQTLVEFPGAELRRRRLLNQMQRLMNPTSSPTGHPPTAPGSPSVEAEVNNMLDDLDFVDVGSVEVEMSKESSSDMPSNSEILPQKRRILPDKSAEALYGNWRKVIPTLVDPQLKYYARTLSQAKQQTCYVYSLIVLLHHGLFPTAPSQPRMAVSVELLSFYRALFERSCDAINALASALRTHYSRRGFQVTDSRGDIVHEPFCRGLGHAVQWYDVLQVEIERQADAALQKSRDLVATRFQRPELPRPDGLQYGRCAPLLVQRCPACFGGGLFGRPVHQGGDIHVATDGNFHHRHRRSAGDCPRFYEPTYFLPKQFVDAVGLRIDVQRKRPVKAHAPIVPDEAIDLCENAYEAADGKKQKAAMDSFDDTGIMALICRHDIPLFFANIDSPGEQQKYSVALIEHLFSLLPPQATVVTLYDVGCVLARSIAKFDILPEDVTSRLRFATTAMHAYGHEWACQLEHNPRMCVGLGLSDGEGTERLWSRFVRLIGVERSSSRQRRLWLIDRQATAIGSEMKADLGEWIKRRHKRGVKDQGCMALDVINRCETSVEDLRAQWTDQRQSQLSIRAHAPARLRKELDTVLSLQADLDASDRALQTTKTMLEKETASDDTLDVLESLQRGHDRLMDKVETLFSSLNVQDRFPELDGVNLDFVRVLLMARDLKMNIRKRAIASFFEWDKLDRAVGGSHQTLGTKLHQHTRKAIAKRQPALMTAIRKFNLYCERLELLHDPTWNIPLPTPLPTKLAELRGDQTLMQDVWITPSIGEVPRWLEDSDIRDGIRALLKRDRCQEEQTRLVMEAGNLCRFFQEELTALELSLRLPETLSYDIATEALEFPPTPDTVVKSASHCAIAHSGAPQNTTPQFASVTMQALAEDEPALPEEDDVEPALPEEEDLAEVEPEQAALADILEGDIAGAEIEEDQDLVANVCAQVVWDSPEDLVVDDFCAPPSQYPHGIVSGHAATRTTTSSSSFPRQIFEPRDISFLASPTALLNDVCINGCAILLQMAISNPTVATFSTHDLPRIRYNATDNMLWRNSSWTRYWEKDVWVLPIHRASNIGHWVLCVIYLSRKELHLFDSLAERKPWKHDVKDIMKFICRLLIVARYHNKEVHIDLDGWVARPLTIKALQTNGYDCGVWILANIIAVLRGRQITGLREDEMKDLRYYLHTRVLSLPVD
ncbi:hypothetical protein C8R48DRAFT_771969 [Suillus tomentosus]|nr:hypothetical protein C8R48DRAFT_771969 [Suillus tomentosus]